MPNIHVRQVAVELSNKLLLDAVSTTFSQQHIHAILGPNGAGKSVFARTLALLHPIQHGSILLDNIPILTPTTKITSLTKYRRQISYLWQTPVFFDGDVFKNVEIPLIIREITRETRRKIVSEGLAELELTDYANTLPAKLSGGQQQRVALLRSLVTKPSVFILDEPTANLDLHHTKWFEDFFTTIHNEQELLIIWITHDFYQAKRISQQTHVIMNGKLLEASATAEIFTHAQQSKVHNYLQGILE